VLIERTALTAEKLEQKTMVFHEMNSGARARELTSTTSPDPIPALTGLRIIGAGWVVLHHFQPTLYEAFPWMLVVSPILDAGIYGVPLFFILSGYIIWHNYGRGSLLAPRTSVNFLWRRFARLWPVNLISQLLAVPLIYWAVVTQNYWGAPIPDWYSWGGLAQSSFMVSGLVHPEVAYPWNQPSWTLTAEMVAYTALPLIVALALGLRVIKTRHVWIWTLLGLSLAYGYKLALSQFAYRWLAELVLIFFIGVLIRIGVAASSVPRIAAVTQIVAPVIVVVACYVNPDLIPCLLAAWVWSLSAKTGLGVRFLSLRPMQIAGLSSYSLYMLHWIVFGYTYIAMFYFPRLRDSLLSLVVVVVLVIVGLASFLCWKFFESPARKFLNGRFEVVWPKRVGVNSAPVIEKAEDVVRLQRDASSDENQAADGAAIAGVLQDGSSKK
jgi:peptidoglycan/LPS O-acetylase OafA/YrhL